MPFHLVITKEGGSDAVTAVPSGWVLNNAFLYWPRTSKKTEIEALRSNGNSKYEEKWRQQKCRVKLKDIGTFHEATKLEEMYANFEDTEDEEAYFRKLKNQRQHPTHKFTDICDLNSEFEKKKMEVTKKISHDKMHADNIGPKTITINSSGEISSTKINGSIDTVTETNLASSGNNFTISEEELMTLINNNNMLSDEIRMLKEDNKRLNEENQHLNAHIIDRDRQYGVIQVKLDKIINLVESTKKSKGQNNNMAIDVEEETITDLFTFPIGTKEELERLEENLANKDLEKRLVKKFSDICGRAGALKFARVGITIIKHILTDELLYECTWKGIKGCKKTPFMQYTRTRDLLYNIIHLADRSCTSTDVDNFIQNSAIKHSGQRLKRKRDNDIVEIAEKKLKEINIPQKVQREMETGNDEMSNLGAEKELKEVNIPQRIQETETGDEELTNLGELNSIILTNELVTNGSPKKGMMNELLY